MRYIIKAVLCCGLLLGGCAVLNNESDPRNGPYKAIPLEGFSDSAQHWRNLHGANYAKYEPTQIVEIADNVLLYQRDNGGWVENNDPTRILSEKEKAEINREKTNPMGSFDNHNIYPQIEYLAAAFTQTDDARYRDALMKGLDYVFMLQHKRCGGWPHTVPGKASFHPYITMADSVTSGVLSTLRLVASGSEPFAFTNNPTRERARQAVERGDECILRLQVVQNGQPAGWAGQYHPETLQPAQGRSFELPAMVSQESVEVVRYLMSIPSPSPAVVRSIDGAMAWFERSKIKGMKIETIKLDKPVTYDYHTATTDRRLVEDPAAPALWARFYDVTDNSVVLANRDGVRVSKYSDIHPERRTGYAWYGTWPSKLVDTEYPAWKVRVGR